MNFWDYLIGDKGQLEKPFLLGKDERPCYNELHSGSLSLAHGLRKEFGQDQNIILVSPNSSFFILCYLAIMKSGNTCVPLNPGIQDSHLAHISKACNATLAIVSPELEQPRWKSLGRVTYGIEALLSAEGPPAGTGAMEKDFDGDRTAEIIFTSGSTGAPKGVMLSHGNLVSNTESILSYLKLSHEDVMEVVLPFHYCYGLSLLHTHLKVGGSMVLNNRFMFLGSVIDDLIKYKCTGFAGVPSHFQMLLRKSKSFKDASFPHLRYVTQAGGRLHNAFIQEFVDAFPKVDFYTMYGQTEATARLSFLEPEMIHAKLGSIGKAIPGVELELQDEDGFRIHEADTIGELLARGPNIMKGYLREEKESRLSLRGGWLHTGDLAYRDEEGFLFLAARKKEIIKVGGTRISPREIEELIVKIPGVLDCSISAIEDELLGEALSAEVVVSDLENNPLDANFIRHYCGEHLSPEKIPGSIRFKKQMHLAPTGKKLS